MAHMEADLWLPGAEGGDITWENAERKFWGSLGMFYISLGVLVIYVYALVKTH